MEFFLYSPVLCTNSKYVSYVWTVLCLYILTSSNISEIYMKAYFEYICDILLVIHIHFSSKSYHLTRWQKQICRLLVSFELSIQRCSEIEVAKLCMDFLAIFNRTFLVLFSSFELHFIFLNHLSTSILFDWILAVAMDWLIKLFT